jgi:leucyl aminopeptidase
MATTLKFSDKSPLEARTDAVALLVKKGYEMTAMGEEMNRKLGGVLQRVLREQAFLVKDGNTMVYYAEKPAPGKIILVGCRADQLRTGPLREAAYAAVRAAQSHGVKRLAIAFDPSEDAEVQAAGEGALLAGYRFRKYKSEANKTEAIKEILLCSRVGGLRAVEKAIIFAEATMFVRDLVNEPANVVNPLKLEEAARKIAKDSGLAIRVFEPPELESMGAGSFLSVGKGSEVAARMIHLTYEPEYPCFAHVALVGKGLTFDSGGLSLKNEKAMEHMKSDMAGAANVLACLRAVAQLKLPVKVSGIVMATENMPDGGANRPGDVVRAMNGKTIEITNTDAEGRLALADGLTYIQESNPDYILDLATLTGAQSVALGRLMGAVIGNDERLVSMIVEAGERSGEKMWPLPLFEPYRVLIESDIADVKNSSGIPDAGTIQGALFLSEFVTHPHWAHLDIAGPSWQDRDWNVHGRMGSGFGARCLLTFLSDLL